METYQNATDNELPPHIFSIGIRKFPKPVNTSHPFTAPLYIRSDCCVTEASISLR